ncbi:MAG: hypothetical protein GX571_03695 [Lentisphaerae bacterium]|nr:hypothetical protein [Lentisphaerota bacterium]
MKPRWFLPTLVLLPLAAAAATLDVPRLPSPVFADREVSGDATLPTGIQDDLRRFRLELSFDATPTNNVQVAFGRDAEPLDGALAAEEAAFIIGWDSGEWFLRPAGLKERFVHAPADGQTPRQRNLRAAIRVNTQGTPTAVEFSDDAGAFAFEGLPPAPPPLWLAPDNWNLLRVTVRGAAIADEDVRVRFLPDGATIILR